MATEDALAEHYDFEVCLDLDNVRKPKEGLKVTKLKKLIAQILLEAVRIDRKMGMYMLEMYQKE